MNTTSAYPSPSALVPPARQRPASPWMAGVRLLRPHSASRRAPVAVAAIAACAAMLRLALQHHWGAQAQQVPLVIEAGTATIIAATTRSPFGESERDRPLAALLRLGLALALTAIVVAALAAGSAGAHLAGGELELLRDVAGLLGIGLLTAPLLGAYAWVGPIAYAVVAEYALTANWTSPWIWPGRSPHDQSAAIWAVLIFFVGVTLIAT